MQALDRVDSSSYPPGMVNTQTVVDEVAGRFCRMNVMLPCDDAPCAQHTALAEVAVNAVLQMVPGGTFSGSDWRTSEALWDGRKLYRIEQRSFKDSYGDRIREEVLSEASAPNADLISSRVLGRADEEALHLPAIDIDLPVRAVPSATPGHSHLYIQKALPFPVYMKMLHALVEAQIVEPDYVRMTEKRGASFLFMPGRGNAPKKEKLVTVSGYR